MRMKNIIGMIALMLAVTLNAEAGALPGTEVRLVAAQPWYAWNMGYTLKYCDFIVHVGGGSLIPRAGQAFIRYDDGSGIWQDQALTLQGRYGDHLTYSGRVENVYGMTFKVGYKVLVGTIWDDNDGSNYSSLPGAVGENVGLYYAERYITYSSGSSGYPVPSGMGLSGELRVKNLSFKKIVGILATSDGWATYKDIPAVYDSTIPLEMHGSGSDVEIWTFDDPTFASGPATAFTADVQFAVYYEDVATGNLYWDNNFDKDYTLTYPAHPEVY